MAKNKVDLTLLKRLVEELESTLAKAEEQNASGDKTAFIVEGNKATGLAAGVMMEAGMLMGDIQSLLQGNPSSTVKSDFLDKLLGPLKGPGSTN